MAKSRKPSSEMVEAYRATLARLNSLDVKDMTKEQRREVVSRELYEMWAGAWAGILIKANRIE